MAQIIYSLCSGSQTYDPLLGAPELLLFNTNGYTNLKHAISKVIEKEVDIVLYAQGWSFGGNFDGGGFINKEVDRATAAGVLWVNAAGNYNKTTYVSSNLRTSSDGSVYLPHQGKYLRLDHQYADIPLKVTLAWNDFTDDENYSTQQDLDLYLEDSSGRVVAKSEKRQSGTPNDRPPSFSRHAREIISTDLAAGRYRIKVRNISQNFTDKSQFRIIISTYGVTLHDRSMNQNVLIPADNSTVITVGSKDGSFSARNIDIAGKSFEKPDIESISRVVFSDGNSYISTSTAAAIAAAQFSLYRGRFGVLSRERAIQVYKTYDSYRTLKKIKKPKIAANIDIK